MKNDAALINIHSPFFSIGVTAFKRKDLLRQLLNSLINQDFADFEVIIGNDYLEEPLTLENLYVSDNRIRIINNKVNLGERENMNSILMNAKGLYFSWIFDDDLCHPNLLSESYKTLLKFNYPACVFTGYKFFYGESEYKFQAKEEVKPSLYGGKEFLRKYLSGELRTLGLAGFHKTDYLQGLGGAKRLSKGHMALYSEYLLVVQDGLLSSVAFIPSECNMVRVHKKSWSKEMRLDLFKEAGINLIKESIVILSGPEIREDYQKNLTSLIKSVVSVLYVKSKVGQIRHEKIELENYIKQIRNLFDSIDDSYLYELSLKSLEDTLKSRYLFIIKATIKKYLPDSLSGFIHFWQAALSKFTNKPF